MSPSTSPLHRAAWLIALLWAAGCGRGGALTIDPSASTVEASETVTFTARASGAAAAVSWSVEEAAGGTITAEGRYTAPASSGTFHVVARASGASARAEVAVVASTRVALTPSRAWVYAGAQVQFSSTVRGDDDGAVQWSVVEPDGGAVTSSGAYTAPATPGTFRVRAQSQKFSAARAEATLTVLPAPVVVSVSPSHVELLQGEVARFSATVSGSTDPRVTWSVEGPAPAGTVTAEGEYQAPARPGRYQVVARSVAQPDEVAAASVEVASQFQVSPRFTELRPGAAQRFTATARGGGAADVSWSVREGSAGGTITAAGVYTAPTAGPARATVVATLGQNPLDVVESSVAVLAAPTTVSGTVTASGPSQGRIYLVLSSSNQAQLGTSLEAPGPFTLRGIERPGTYHLAAFRDVLGTMAAGPVSPFAQTDVRFDGKAISGVTLALEEPTLAPLTEPPAPMVLASQSAALVMLPPLGDADHVKVAWSSAAAVLGQRTFVASPTGFAIIDALAAGQALTFTVTPIARGVDGPVSPASMPVTLGAQGGPGLEGTVSAAGLHASGPVYVLARFAGVPVPAGFARLAAAPSPTTYRIEGLPPVPLEVVAFIDADGDGQLGPGDPSTEAYHRPQVAPSAGDRHAEPLALFAGPVLTAAQLDHSRPQTGEHLAMLLGVLSAEQTPVRASLRTGPPLGSALDLPLTGLHGDAHLVQLSLGEAPAAGATYTFDVTWPDGGTASFSRPGPTPLPLPEAISPVGTGSRQPTFSWRWPTPLPAGTRQTLVVGQNGTGEVWAVRDLDRGVTSLTWNSDHTASVPELGVGEVNWSIIALDEQGNRASADFSFITQ
ncbi:MAG: hypothetical protein IPJ65_04810 [Archangiaceae bacterium]|nr:hypothetical protein [Archangiaceae bacterium]